MGRDLQGAIAPVALEVAGGVWPLSPGLPGEKIHPMDKIVGRVPCYPLYSWPLKHTSRRFPPYCASAPLRAYFLLSRLSRHLRGTEKPNVYWRTRNSRYSASRWMLVSTPRLRFTRPSASAAVRLRGVIAASGRRTSTKAKSLILLS